MSLTTNELKTALGFLPDFTCTYVQMKNTIITQELFKELTSDEIRGNSIVHISYNGDKEVWTAKEDEHLYTPNLDTAQEGMCRMERLNPPELTKHR